MDLRLEIASEKVACKQNGKELLSVPLADFLDRIVEDSDQGVLAEAIPEGVRFLRRRGDAVALVMEEKPQVRTVRWLSDDSPVPFGPGAKYREARLAFPYVVVVVVLVGGALTGLQQCFYRTSALKGQDDPLLLPNLYNVAKGHRQQCWLCLVNVSSSLGPLSWEDKVREIRTHLWSAAFNQSSEEHEGMSYWQAMRGLDPRLKSVAAWEEATAKDPCFPLAVRWKPAGKTVGALMEEMLSAVRPARSSASVAGLVHLLNLCQGTRRTRP